MNSKFSNFFFTLLYNIDPFEVSLLGFYSVLECWLALYLLSICIDTIYSYASTVLEIHVVGLWCRHTSPICQSGCIYVGCFAFLVLFWFANSFRRIHGLQQVETPSNMQKHKDRRADPTQSGRDPSHINHPYAFASPRASVTEVDRSAAPRSTPICTWRAGAQSPVPSVACQNPTGPAALRKCKYPLMVLMQMDASMTIAPVLALFVSSQ